MEVFRVIDAADQQFGTIINNRRVTIRLRYNPTSERWSFDLAIDDLPVLQGRRIVTGVDLLSAFRKGIAKSHGFDIGLIFAAATSAGGAPDRSALPDGTVRLYHLTTAEAITEGILDRFGKPRQT